MTDNIKNLTESPEISLQLDRYADIFSDFDPRPYEKKALSDDFLAEAKRASMDKDIGKIELRLLIPKEKRKIQKEIIIKKRIKEHFKRHFNLLKNERYNTIKRGLGFIAVGVILMFTATYILFSYEEKSLLMNFLIILLEPGGWFMFWEGLGLIVFESKSRTSEYKFYEKMSKCDISFFGY